MPRILMTGSRGWTNAQISADALNAAVALLATTHGATVLVHGAAKGADTLLADAATRLKMATEAHPAQWSTHTDACPPAHRGQDKCKMAGHRRNADMVALGADVCLAFPTHPHVLPSGTSTANTSRGTWSCAEKASAAGIPTLVVWGDMFYPFGDAGTALLRANAEPKGLELGSHGQMRLVEAWLPF